jgi:hypothetical protein
LTKLTKNIKLYSKLLKSVGRQGRGLTQKQPLSPVECGTLIQRLIDEEKEDKYQIVERLDLGRPKDGKDIYKKRDTTQLDSFLSLLKVSEKSRDYAGWGWEGLPKIPFSTIVQLSTFPHDEQDKVLQTALKSEKKSSEILKKEVIKLKKWRIENPKLTIEEGIQKILKLKPVTIITHVIVCMMEDKLKKFVQSNLEHKEKILEIFRNKIEGKFYEIEITDKLLTLSMDEEAYKKFYVQQFEKGISFTEFVNNLLEKEIA